MDDFLKMDIFFGVATIAMIIVTALLAVVLMYVIRLLRTLDRLGQEVAEEAKALRADLDDVRQAAKKGGSEIASLIKALVRYGKRLLGGGTPRKRKSTS